MNARILFLLLIGFSNLSISQETTIIKQYSDNGLSENYQLRQSSQYTFVVNYYAPKSSPESQAAELLSSGLDIYIDKSYQIGDNNFNFNYETAQMMSEMSSLVNQGLSIFQIEQVFEGFSDKVYLKLNKLASLNWNKAEYEILGDNSEERKEMLRYFIDTELLDLKGLCRTEVLNFLENEYVLQIPDTWANKMQISSDIELPIAYQTDYFIEPLEYTLNDPVSSLENDQELSLPKSFVDDYNKQIKKKNKKKKRRKDQFSADVLALLEQNSEQLIAIQKDLVDFQKDNIERDREIRRENNDQSNVLQKQIDELKEAIYSDSRSPKDLNVYERSIAAEKVVVLFEKNSSEISSQYKLQLNKILSELIKNPDLKIMITGFADKSGNPDFNAYISQRRAEVVKKYLYKKGIANKRMLMNYLGDLSSTSENANDRRVEIEFINDIGHIELSSN